MKPLFASPFARSLRFLLSVAVVLVALRSSPAQRHSLGSAPPTAPPAAAAVHATPQPTTLPLTGQHANSLAAPIHTVAAASGPIGPVSTGLGAIQFSSSSASVPAPQTLTRQLSADDERLRLAALAAVGAPGQYLNRGHVPFPHSLELDMLQLGADDELDALITIELDQHVTSAILVPEDGGWRRVATLSFASSFNDGATTPSNFVRPLRSWLQPGRYRAVYHATVNGTNGDFTENEADVRVLNGHAAVVISFVSGARQCDTTGQLRPPHQTCELLQRWIEPDPTDPTHHFTLITGMGHISAHEADDPLSHSRNYRLTRLRSFSCQPLAFSDSAQRFEPVANSTPCAVREPPPGPRASGGGPDRPDRPDRPDHLEHLEHLEHLDHADHP